MITTALFLRPFDQLFFRDGRAFGATSRVVSGLPNPTTLAGALRTLVLNVHDANFQVLGREVRNGATLENAFESAGAPPFIARMRVRGPWLARIEGKMTDVFFRQPRHLRNGSGAVRLKALPLNESLPGWDDSRGLKPLWCATAEHEKDTGTRGDLIRFASLPDCLNGCQTLPESAFERSDHLYGFCDKTGISIHFEKLTAEESMIYGVRMLCLSRSVGFYCEIHSEQPLRLSERTLFPFGGESRYVLDEFHHAAASTYERLLTHLQPRFLLGLTATPERTDGQSILKWFDGRIAVELRLWDALERGLLCPFQYFGLHDNTDLSRVQWSRRGYDVVELENLYTGDQGRVVLVLRAIREKVANPQSMRALGFCLSVAHAHFMAREFSRQGLPATAVSVESSIDEREGALRDLRDGKINVVFCVDLFNEGVDVPEIDTVLFLRPTESSLVFLQQLGRGLRQSDGKSCLTVLDLLGEPIVDSVSISVSVRCSVATVRN